MNSTKYIDLSPWIFNTTGIDMPSEQRLKSIRCVLNWLDEHPDQTPVRTITESEYEEIVEWCHSMYGVARGPLSAFGRRLVTVVPDPKPTPRQRLEAMIFEKWGDADDAQMITMSILDEFDVSVKAPEADND